MNSQEPSNTSSPISAPIEFSGMGDDVIDFDNPFGPCFAHITYEGEYNFAVCNIDENNTEISLLVNVIGTYDGYVPIDILNDEHTMRFKVESSGLWEITIYPLALDYIHTCEIPGTCEGQGDDVIALIGAKPDIGKVEHIGTGNFSIWACGDEQNLLVNEIGCYNGKVLFRPSVVLLVIQTEGVWIIQIKGR